MRPVIIACKRGLGGLAVLPIDAQVLSLLGHPFRGVQPSRWVGLGPLADVQVME